MLITDPIKNKLSGQWLEWQIIDPRGRAIRGAQQHNLVLTQGKNLLAQHYWPSLTQYAVLGSGTAAPMANQTALSNEVARSTSNPPLGEADSLTRIADGHYRMSRVRQLGNLENLNLTEWGWSFSPTAGSNICVRELFRDSQGNPVALSVQPGQQLRLVYSQDFTVGPTVPTPFSLNIAGLGTRTGKHFLTGTNSGGISPEPDLAAVGFLMAGSSTHGYGNMGSPLFAAFANRPSPEGYSSAGVHFFNNNQNYSGFSVCSTRTYAPYSLNSFKREVSLKWDVDRANFEIAAFGAAATKVGISGIPGVVGWWFVLDSGQTIAKDNLHELSLEGLEVSWS
jgi:hypothetical protein